MPFLQPTYWSRNTMENLTVYCIVAFVAIFSQTQASAPEIKWHYDNTSPNTYFNISCHGNSPGKMIAKWSSALFNVSTYNQYDNTLTSNSSSLDLISTLAIKIEFDKLLESGYCQISRNENNVMTCPFEATCYMTSVHNDTADGTYSTTSNILLKWQIPTLPAIEVTRKATSTCAFTWPEIKADASDYIPIALFSLKIDLHQNTKHLRRNTLSIDSKGFQYRDLTPYTLYNISLHMILDFNGDVWQSQSKFAIVRTLALVPRTSPSFVDGLETGIDFVVAKWQDTPLPVQNGMLASVHLSYERLTYGEKNLEDLGLPGHSMNTVVDATKGTVLVLSNLLPWSQYILTLKACNDDGFCDSKGSQTTVNTKEGVPSGVPLNLTLVHSGSNYIKISYTSPVFLERNGNIIGFKYRIGSFSGGEDASYRPKRDVSSFEMEKTFNDLQPYSYFNISVAAETMAGVGPYSPTLNVKTLEGSPSMPIHSTLMRLPSDMSCMLQWEKPITPNGIISGYVIKSFCNDQPYDETEVSADRFTLTSGLNCNASSCISFQVLAKTIVYGKPSPILYARDIIDFLPKFKPTITVVKGIDYNLYAFIGIACLLLLLIIILLVAFCIYKKRYTNKLVRNHILMHSIPSPLHLKDFGISDVVRSHADLYEPRETDALTTNPETTALLYSDDESGHRAIPVEEFPRYMEQKLRDDHPFKHEYKRELKAGKCYSWDIADRPENKPKNRYTNIAAYDHSRVILRSDSGKRRNESDYFNANHIEGYCQGTKTSYIACHGPTESVVPDFWRLIWQEKIAVIVMLTNVEERGKAKCYQYWPSFGTIKSGNMTITAMGQDITVDYKIRTFELSKAGVKENRIIKQFHFVSWPDHGVPDRPTPLISLRRRVRAFYDGSAPMLVHCSAGVGRTGCFILVDAEIERITETGYVDVFNYLQYVRTRRIDMVQTLAQYKFAHNVLLEYITCGCTEIPAADFQKRLNSLKRGSGLRDEYETLTKTTSIAKEQANFNRVFLQEGQRISYVDAFFVDGYKRNDAFIVCSAPDQNDIARFWKIVVEQQCHTIVSLHRLKENGKFHCQYWPSPNEQISVGDQSVVLLSEHREPEMIIRKFKVLNSNDNFHIQQFQYIDWPDKGIPSSRSNLLKLMSLVEKSQQQFGNGPIMVQCSNGVGRSGTFISIYNSTDRLKTEQLIDVLQCVRAIRANRPMAVESFEQYNYIYSMISTYLEAFQTYSNFEQTNLTLPH